MIRRLNRLNEFTLIGKTALTFSLAILLCVTLASPAVAQDDILGDIKSDSAQQNTTNDSSADQSVADAATTVVDDEAADSSAGNGGSESTSSDAGDTENSDEEAGNTIDETTGTVSGSSWEKFKNAGALGLLLDGGLFMWPILIMG
nr:hypothetical protein [Pirellulaceae bacterium]